MRTQSLVLTPRQKAEVRAAGEKFAMADTNGDGTVSPQEWEAFHRWIAKQPCSKSGGTAPRQSESELEHLEAIARNRVTLLKQEGLVMEKDKTAVEAISKLQEVTQKLVMARYGKFSRGGPNNRTFIIEMEVQFPRKMLDIEEQGTSGVIVVETAPLHLVPHSVLLFLEMASHWRGGAFTRNANHVLQARPQAPHAGLAFQEYSPEYPHKALTLGFAGRPGGPGFYISKTDNRIVHGPGSQGSNTEADSCFAKVLTGLDVVARLGSVWGKSEFGFNSDVITGVLADRDDFATIVRLELTRQSADVMFFAQ